MVSLYVLVGGTAAFLIFEVIARKRAKGRRWPTALRRGLAAMFIVTGVAHFVGLREDLIAMVPPVLPVPGLLVSVTGALELVGAAGLLWRRTAAWSAAGLTALLVGMFPANIYAAVSQVSIGGAPPTPLPVRTAMQILYVTAALIVWSTHHRADAAAGTSLQTRSAPTLALRAAAGPASNHSSPGLVLVSRLALRRLRDVPGFLSASLRLRKAFRSTPGAAWLRLSVSPFTATFWTWSAWVDEQAMAAYTRSDMHRAVMIRYRERLHDSRFQTLRVADGTRLPGTWEETRALVAAPATAVVTRAGERVRLGVTRDCDDDSDRHV